MTGDTDFSAAKDAAWKEVRRMEKARKFAQKRFVALFKAGSDCTHATNNARWFDKEYAIAKKKWVAAFKAECEATRTERTANPDWLRCIFPKSSRGLPIRTLSVPEYVKRVKANCAALLAQ